ncbi:MAG: hypothetical protein N2038_10135 [Geminicoccaceae bacterium]|nr:hypothetical protein [Geminicoccaceae bacterium]MCS7267073.1 hypothetical protein [Geminicoccaceae bacterium]MCX7630596.1 hypothetical protein [Geminicoccaceae bacterium]MDW8124944.1 hypothetical protein [Geminicoccaceae bacterium]MDW8342274.1 hypothetical protein [Geminicoccaceae bacterium]
MIAAAALGFAFAALVGTADAQPLDRSLGGLLPFDRAETASVRVEAFLEDEGGRRALLVRLTPLGRAKLVADPGIQAVPLPGPRGPWSAVPRVEIVDPDRGYFQNPVELRLPVLAGATGEAAAEVAYAWCGLERICLFGSTTVSVLLSDPSS